MIAALRLLALRWGHALVAVAWVYALTFLDRHFGWWPAAGLDFSTHTGVALAVGIAIGRHSRRLRLPVATALVLYAAYMLMRGYHSALDVVTSAAAVAPVALLVPRRSPTE